MEARRVFPEFSGRGFKTSLRFFPALKLTQFATVAKKICCPLVATRLRCAALQRKKSGSKNFYNQTQNNIHVHSSKNTNTSSHLPAVWRHRKRHRPPRHRRSFKQPPNQNGQASQERGLSDGRDSVETLQTGKGKPQLDRRTD